MNVLQVIVTDFGEFPCPPDLDCVALGLKLRKDRQPDKRTKAGKEWYRRFRLFENQKLQEWAA